MKINDFKRYFIGIAMTAFLATLAGDAFGDALGTNRNPSRDFGDGSKCGATCSEWANNYMVVAPYWQTEGGASYTFIAVTHSSLSGMASQIGVKVNAITSAGTAYDTAETFTVLAGDTKRVFIIPTNHATINSTTVSDAVFLAGTTNFSYGHVRIGPGTTAPQAATLLALGTGQIPTSAHGDGFRDTTMLTYWGSVIVEANTTGFAMEFIGDLNDSQTTAIGLHGHFNNANYMASGVNID